MSIVNSLLIGNKRVEFEFLDPPLSFLSGCSYLHPQAPGALLEDRTVALVTIRWMQETNRQFHLRHARTGAGGVVYPIHEWRRPFERAREVGGSWHVRIEGPLGLSLFCPETRRLEVFRLVPAGLDPTPNTLLIPLLQPAFAANDCLLVHAAGVVLEGRGALVTGPSGSGKSTSASLLGGHILSDDIVCVSEISRTPTAASTPFGRVSDGERTSSLRAIFFPHKAASFALRALAPREAAARFLSEHRAFFRTETFPHLQARIARNAMALFQRVPAFELHFDGTFIDRAAVLKGLEVERTDSSSAASAPM